MLTKTDPHQVPNSPKEIRLFATVRNEDLRLPYFFQYYKEIGVDRFFVVDNDSTDETLPLLLSQDSTHVFRTNESYQKAHYGHSWITSLLEVYGRNHWCIVVDADEIFCYPHYEKLSIRNLCDFLEEEGSKAMGGLLLDMYSDKPLYLTNYKKGENFLSVCNYFDRDLPYTFFGGMRKRVFKATTCLKKFSLFKYEPNVSIGVGCHGIEGAKLSEATSCVLHFKYFSDFIARAKEEAKRGEHWQKAVEYKKYAKKIRRNSNLTFHHRGSVKFENSNQLVNLGFMKTSPILESKCKTVSKKIKSEVRGSLIQGA